MQPPNYFGSIDKSGLRDAIFASVDSNETFCGLSVTEHGIIQALVGKARYSRQKFGPAYLFESALKDVLRGPEQFIPTVTSTLAMSSFRRTGQAWL